MKKTLKLLSVLLAFAMVMGMPLGGLVAEEAKAPYQYTYLDALTVSPVTWSPHTNQSVDDSYILDHIGTPLYVFDFLPESPEVGYKIKPEMAADMPEDLTKEYAGKPEWNVPEGAEEGYVYRIPLNEKAVWEDGTPINADSYIYSMQQLLAPEMQNHRADLFYSGSLVMTKAKDYVYQNQTKPIPLSEYIAREQVESIDKLLEEKGAEAASVNWNYSFGERYDQEAKAWTKEEVKDEVVAAGCDLAAMRDLFVEKVTSWGEPEEKALAFFADEAYIEYTFPEVKWDAVGLQKTGEYEITFFFDKPLVGFYLFYNLSNKFLVNKDLYEACKKTTEGSELVTSSYCTKLENTISYGPYKLINYQDDKVIELARNDSWYGYSDGNHEGMYQTDHIVCTIVKESATRLQMFLSGQLDEIGLNSDQVGDYRGSDFIYYTLSQYTGSLNINGDVEKLKAREEEGINKTILSIKDFRKALAWSVDRKDFAATTTASSSAGFGLLNSRYIADVDNIIPYRNFDAAKDTLCKVYGIEYGEGKDYKDLEEGYAALTGYDLDGAKELFNSAYDQAIEQGLMKETDKVVLTYYTGEDTENTRKTYNYLRDNWIKAVEGTKLEGKFDLEFDPTAGNDFGKNFRAGMSDMLMAGWQGAAFNPFYFMLAYLADNYRYAMSFNPNMTLTMEIEGKEVKMTAQQWYDAMMGDNPDYAYGPNDASMELRIQILAMLEAAVLEDYTACPMIYGSSASLKSQKIEYHIEGYNELLGRGGIEYLTYNYTDAEWEAYLSENNGILDYK